MKALVTMGLMLAVTISTISLMDGKIMGEQKAEAGYGPMLAQASDAVIESERERAVFAKKNRLCEADFATALKIANNK